MLAIISPPPTQTRAHTNTHATRGKQEQEATATKKYGVSSERLRQVESDLAALQARNGQAEMDLEKSKVALQHTEYALTQTKTEKRQLQEQVDDLKRQCAESERQLVEQRERAERQSQEHVAQQQGAADTARLESRLASAVQLKKQMEAELLLAQQQVSALRKKVLASETAREEAEATSGTLQRRLSRVQAEAAASSTSDIGAFEKLAALTQERDQLRRKLMEAETDKGFVQTQLDRMSKQLADAEATSVLDLVGKVETLQEANAALQQQVASSSGAATGAAATTGLSHDAETFKLKVAPPPQGGTCLFWCVCVGCMSVCVCVGCGCGFFDVTMADPF